MPTLIKNSAHTDFRSHDYMVAVWLRLCFYTWVSEDISLISREYIMLIRRSIAVDHM